MLRKPLNRLIGNVEEDKLRFRIDSLEHNLQTLNLQKLHALYQSDDVSQRTFLQDKELKVYSQNGEDGLLLYLFSQIGSTNKSFVEFGVEDGKECNTANLSINFGWNGLLMDCDWKQVVKAKHYYKNLPSVKPCQVKVIQCFVTAENINKVLLDNGMKGTIDLLSIDIDGNDYWIWKAISAVDPRVVVIEYNASLDVDKAWTVEYDPEFVRYEKHRSGCYHGASLKALAKLADSKGYGLVGCESSGANAFFVKKDLLRSLRNVSLEDAYYPHFRRLKKESTRQQFERVRHLNWVDVG